MKLSIIVPAYKVEDYIAACLKSLLDQGMNSDEFEIIVINDGSPDNSRAIAEEFAAKHSNIIVLDQENQGVSVARNAGLDVANGEYIAFVDPDDTLYPDSLKPVLARADEENLEILYLSLDAYDEAGNFLQTAEANGRDHEVLDGFHHSRRTYLSTLYRRDVIGSTRFTAGITRGQDTVFNMMVQAKAKRCSYCSLPYYKYLQRNTSSRQFVGTERNFRSCLLAIETIHSFQMQHFPEPTEAERRYFDAAILIFIRRTLEWIILPQSNKKSFDLLKQKLAELGLQRLIVKTAEYFKMFDKPFVVFRSYLRVMGMYSRIRKLFA